MSNEERKIQMLIHSNNLINIKNNPYMEMKNIERNYHQMLTVSEVVLL